MHQSKNLFLRNHKNLHHCLSLSSLPLFTFSQNASSSFPFGFGHIFWVQKTPTVEFLETHPQKLQPSVRVTRRLTPSHLWSLKSHIKPREASLIFSLFCLINALQKSRCLSFDGSGHIIRVHIAKLAPTRQWQILQPSERDTSCFTPIHFGREEGPQLTRIRVLAATKLTVQRKTAKQRKEAFILGINS